MLGFVGALVASKVWEGELCVLNWLIDLFFAAFYIVITADRQLLLGVGFVLKLRLFSAESMQVQPDLSKTSK